MNSADPQNQGLVIGAVIAVMGIAFALIGAVVSAIAGYKGAVRGAKIAADAVQDATKRSQAEAQADREEARQARFADRTRELAAELLEVTERYRRDAGRRFRDAGRRSSPDPVLDPAFGQLVAELRLIVRLPATLTAMTRLEQALDDVDMQLGWGRGTDGMGVDLPLLEDWKTQFTELATTAKKAVDDFEDAIRDDLDRPRVERSQGVPAEVE
jgi:hypothetical protein